MAAVAPSFVPPSPPSPLHAVLHAAETEARTTSSKLLDEQAIEVEARFGKCRGDAFHPSVVPLQQLAAIQALQKLGFKDKGIVRIQRIFGSSGIRYTTELSLDDKDKALPRPRPERKLLVSKRNVQLNGTEATGGVGLRVAVAVEEDVPPDRVPTLDDPDLCRLLHRKTYKGPRGTLLDVSKVWCTPDLDALAHAERSRPTSFELEIELG